MGQIKVRGKMQRVAVTPSVTVTLGFFDNKLLIIKDKWK